MNDYGRLRDRLSQLRGSVLALALVLCGQPLIAQSDKRWQYADENDVEMAVVYSTTGKGVVLVLACVTGDLAIALYADVNSASVELRWQVAGYEISDWLPWVRLDRAFYLPISLEEGKQQRSRLIAQGRAGSVISIQFRGSDSRLHYTLAGFTASTNKLSCINR